MKLAGMVSSGFGGKACYSGWKSEGERRDRVSARKKLYNGDVVSFKGEVM